MTPRAVAALGIGQCVNWGVLYYAFAILLLPIEADLRVPRWTITGAFSVALLASAAAAPAIGRWTDRGRGPRVILLGGLAGAVLLAVWSFSQSIVTLYVIWAALGFCMAATLYEPAFAIVGRTHENDSERLRALALVTVFGGLASTVFLPLTAVLVGAIGWRGAVLALAAILAISTAMTHALALRQADQIAPPVTPAPASRPGLDRTSARRAASSFGIVALVFSFGSLGSAAFSTNLVPALEERQISPATAAMLGGLLGVMQLPGRAMLLRGSLAASPVRLVVISLALQSTGLMILSTAHALVTTAAGIMVFAAGAGMTTLARPHLVQTFFGVSNAGHLNGRLARYQQLARAAGPTVAALLATVAGYSALLFSLSAAFGLLAVASYRNLRFRESTALERSFSNDESTTAGILDA